MRPLLQTPAPVFARRSMAAAAWNRAIYFFGGVGHRGTESIRDVDNELWRFHLDELTWEFLGKGKNEATDWPAVRRCVGFAAGPQGLYLWGGSSLTEEDPGYSFLNDLWLYHPDQGTWSLLEASEDFHISPTTNFPRPEPRYTPMWHFSGSKAWLFSGYTEDRLGKRKLNDLWSWDAQTKAWHQEGPSGQTFGYSSEHSWPGLRYGSMAAINEHKLIIFGGFSDDGDHNDLWSWDIVQRRWDCLFPDSPPGTSVPAPRYSAAFAHYDGQIWLFGGRSRRDPKQNYNDTWTFNLGSRRWELVEAQSALHRYDSDTERIGYHAKMAVSSVDNFWYIWGGEGYHGHVSDFWRFDLRARGWQMIQPARPDDPRFW